MCTTTRRRLLLPTSLYRNNLRGQEDGEQYELGSINCEFVRSFDFYSSSLSR